MRLDPDVAALLGPVRAPLDAGLAALGADMGRVSLGEIDAFWRDDADGVVLSAGLLGPEVNHPLEPATAPLDRWRRALASVLEAAALRTIGPAPAWARIGLAIDRVDRAVPDARIADPDVATAIATGDLGVNPRAGVAIVRAWRAQGVDPEARVSAFAVDPEEWLALARWVLDPRGAAAGLAVPVARVAAADVPVALGPWSFRPLAVPAHPRGGQIAVDGPGAVSPSFARGKRVYKGLAAAAEAGARFVPAPGGPVGRWELKSAQGYGQVLGSRGMTFVLEASGRLEIELADAFTGPLAALDQAAKMGTSGVVPGVWMVDAADAIRFDRIDPQGIATHGRSVRDPVVPAQEFGMGPVLKALMDEPWTWSNDEDRLWLRGRVMGGPVEMRLVRVSAR